MRKFFQYGKVRKKKFLEKFDHKNVDFLTKFSHLEQKNLRKFSIFSVHNSVLGTSTVMSLDVLRSIQKSNGSTLKCLFSDIRLKLINASEIPELEPAINRLAKISAKIGEFANSSRIESQNFQLKSVGYERRISKFFLRIHLRAFLRGYNLM